MKLNLKDKHKIIELYEKGYTISQLCNQFNVRHSTIKRIERQYREHGISCLKDKGKNNQYTVEFKYEIVNRILNGESIYGIAAELCINEGHIFSWVKKYKELGYNGLITKRKGRPKLMNPNNKAKKTNETPEIVDDKDRRIKELEERNAQLEMENDLLKKLRALVQRRQQQQSKKK